MRLNTPRLVYVLAIAVVSAGCNQNMSFWNELIPILQANCLSCHDGEGEGVEASGFSVKPYDDLMKGWKSGPVVVQGISLSSSALMYSVV
jgi:hypothetical protein